MDRFSALSDFMPPERGKELTSCLAYLTEISTVGNFSNGGPLFALQNPADIQGWW
jgi:hypothetical protein